LAREQRKLAAILAADVVGYSRLMGRDESGTLAGLRAHRIERLEPTLARHGGRLVKLTGDGALAEFPSAVDALGAAIEFQQAMKEVNRDQSEDTRIVFRIGLHLGDLIVDGDDLYGDGVNVAARLEAEAPAGGVVVSRTVHEAVEGRLKATFDDLGSLALKNSGFPGSMGAGGLAQPGRIGCRGVECNRIDRRCAAHAAGQAFYRRIAVPEHVRRSRAGVFRRRYGRGHHHGAVTH
jgi:class 3 adenylate cyclase